MLVIAHHFVQNPDEFWALAKEIMATSTIPQDLKIHSVFPSKDLKTGTCVWEARSAGDVEKWLDDTFGQFSRNVCYEVNEEIAFGLPEKAVEEALL